MLRRRSFLVGLSLCATLPSTAAARCARILPGAEARRSTVVFEGVLEASVDGTSTFRVTATWLGTPGDHVQVHSSRRSHSPLPHEIGSSWIVFATHHHDALHINSCGSTRPLPADDTLAALAAEGLTRTAHP